jgi:hypothetical protein
MKQEEPPHSFISAQILPPEAPLAGGAGRAAGETKAVAPQTRPLNHPR